MVLWERLRLTCLCSPKSRWLGRLSISINLFKYKYYCTVINPTPSLLLPPLSPSLPPFSPATISSLLPYVFSVLSWISRSNGWHFRAGCLSAQFHHLNKEKCTVCTGRSLLLLNIKNLITCRVLTRTFGNHSGIPFSFTGGHGVIEVLLKSFWGFSSVDLSAEDVQENSQMIQEPSLLTLFLRVKLFKLTVGPRFHLIAVSIC